MSVLHQLIFSTRASQVLALLHQIIHDVGNELAQAQKAEENAETEYRRFMKAGDKRVTFYRCCRSEVFFEGLLGCS